VRQVLPPVPEVVPPPVEQRVPSNNEDVEYVYDVSVLRKRKRREDGDSDSESERDGESDRVNRRFNSALKDMVSSASRRAEGQNLLLTARMNEAFRERDVALKALEVSRIIAEDVFKCMICMSYCDQSINFKFRCGCKDFCVPCCKKLYLINRASKCPSPSCASPVRLIDLCDLGVIDRVVSASIRSEGNSFPCRVPGCSMDVLHTTNCNGVRRGGCNLLTTSVISISVCGCGASHCVTCRTLLRDHFHEDRFVACHHLMRKEAEIQCKTLDADSMCCGECGSMIQKDMGCNTLTCHCKGISCWICGKLLMRSTDRTTLDPGRTAISRSVIAHAHFSPHVANLQFFTQNELELIKRTNECIGHMNTEGEELSSIRKAVRDREDVIHEDLLRKTMDRIYGKSNVSASIEKDVIELH
jgi:hypothetical protein